MAADDADLASSSAVTERDKLYWEVEKLRAETDAIRQPRRMSLTTLGTAVTAIVALLGAGFQYRYNEIAAKTAEFETAQLRSEKEKLEQERASIVRSIDDLVSQSATVGLQLKEAQTQLEAVRAQLARAEAESRAAATAASAETAATLAQAQIKVADLQKATTASEQLRSAQIKELGDIRARVMTPSAPSNLRFAR